MSMQGERPGSPSPPCWPYSMDDGGTDSFASEEKTDKFKMKNSEDFSSGLMFIGFGTLTVVVSRNYSMGSAMNMGPGYFPTVLGFLLIVLGAVITAMSFRREGEGIEPFAWRPMILLSAAFIFFGWGVDRIGFIPSLFVLIVVCAAAGKEFRWGEVLAMSAVLILGSWALFIWLLKVPLPLFWVR